ncbi:MAG: hypothetical protein RI894_221 [Bacteroidota bacterium]|jgi:superfamily II DNA helicase RecQ
MQIKIFTIPAHSPEEFEAEMNRFLRGHRVLDITTNMINSPTGGVFWSFCVRYLLPTNTETSVAAVVKKDYRTLLDEATFERFGRLREIRKVLAKADAVPAYAVFIDAELAGIAALPELSLKNIQGIKGIGESRVAKYGEKMIALWADASISLEPIRFPSTL